MQKFLRHSRKWSALLIGLTVVTLLSILVIGFLEKSLRLGANAKSIENSVQAYYLATGVIEKQLNALKENIRNKPWEITPVPQPTNKWFSGSFLAAHTGSSTIPAKWFGNSPFNSDYNIISVDRPLQLVISDNDVIDGSQMRLQLPVIGGSNQNIEGISEDVVLWTFGNATQIISANPEQNALIKSENIDGDFFSFDDKQGIYYADENGQLMQKNDKTLSDFYSVIKNDCAEYKCTLKFSMLKTVKNTNGTVFPFLEYQLKFNKAIPLQFMTLDATGYVGDYARKRTVQIPQITTNTALDFAVLQ